MCASVSKTEEILAAMRSHASLENLASQSRIGIQSRERLGVSLYDLLKIAKEIKDYELALELWQTGIHEARMLAGMIDEPEKGTLSQLVTWVVEFDSWDTCDIIPDELFIHAPDILEVIPRWAVREEVFVKRMAFAMITLLHLRDIAKKKDQDFSIVSEMLDIRNQNLAEVSQADDFIISNNRVSLMITQISENKKLNSVFQDIFDPEGSEIYLKPVSGYVEIGKPVNFYTIIEAARRRNETAMGYRLSAENRNAEYSYGIYLNSDKSARMIFTENDKIVVLAEE